MSNENKSFPSAKAVMSVSCVQWKKKAFYMGTSTSHTFEGNLSSKQAFRTSRYRSINTEFYISFKVFKSTINTSQT